MADATTSADGFWSRRSMRGPRARLPDLGEDPGDLRHRLARLAAVEGSLEGPRHLGVALVAHVPQGLAGLDAHRGIVVAEDAQQGVRHRRAGDLGAEVRQPRQPEGGLGPIVERDGLVDGLRERGREGLARAARQEAAASASRRARSAAKSASR